MKISFYKFVYKIVWIVTLSCFAYSQSSFSVLTGKTVFKDDFDYENSVQGALNYDNFSNWEIAEGSVDLLGNGFYDFFPQHGMYVDLDGTTNEGGLIRTKSPLSLDAGEYVLRFSLAGSQRTGPDTVTVMLDGVFTHEIILQAENAFTSYEISFTLSQPLDTRLGFDHAGEDNIGILLDEVSILNIIN